MTLLINWQVSCLLWGFFLFQVVFIWISITMKILVVIQLLSHLFLAARACTEIRVKAEDHSVVVGRTMEFMISLASNILVEPLQHYHRTALVIRLPWSENTTTLSHTWMLLSFQLVQTEWIALDCQWAVFCFPSLPNFRYSEKRRALLAKHDRYTVRLRELTLGGITWDKKISKWPVFGCK